MWTEDAETDDAREGVVARVVERAEWLRLGGDDERAVRGLPVLPGLGKRCTVHDLPTDGPKVSVCAVKPTKLHLSRMLPNVDAAAHARCSSVDPMKRVRSSTT